MNSKAFVAAVITATLIIAFAVIALLGYPARDDSGNNNISRYVFGNATVEDIEIIELESFPVQINVVAKGYLPDGCTRIHKIEKDRQGNRFLVMITTIRPADAVCTQVIVPFRETIPLDVHGLKAGSYTVSVNGVTGTFTLAVDNILDAGGPESRLNRSDNGSQVMLNRSQTMVIALEANPTTGYTWEIAEVNSSVLRQAGEIEFQPNSSLAGAGGVQSIRLYALAAGQTQLKLVYHRTFEKDVEPVGTFNIQVAVS
ncbi:MAG TPA: protease inhibitor I42 family protein [Candidatus Methanoperedenaceae archaeon]|nr:protease inhibitor I42 family protein [Candidatus Methanoperedenaceae archaeon]